MVLERGVYYQTVIDGRLKKLNAFCSCWWRFVCKIMICLLLPNVKKECYLFLLLFYFHFPL